MPNSIIYPFTAIVGQEKMKKALILNAINPRIGGVLIYGKKGTAKSTAAKALTSLLPEINTVEGCNYNCDPINKNYICESCKKKFHALHHINIIKKKAPLVEVTSSTIESSLAGTLEYQYTIKNEEKKYKFEPGDLAKANRGIIYVDEINLLNESIINILSNTVTSGVNILKKENYSYSHKSQFVLIGTMNPEEGEIRSKLLDCFGLCIEVEKNAKHNEILEIIKRKKEFEKNPADFIIKFSDEENKLRDKIAKAKETLEYVTISGTILRFISKYCIEAFVSWNRAQTIIKETACTIAALYERDYVTKEDALEAVDLVLSHRSKESSNIRYRIRERMCRASS
ncbi:ATP-binding protein [Clostridium sp. PL3]|uniref:Mg-protoporphyrin IX chelatase n=1 Tax=Clostridium thailandense TaxID=2794346 RepID=A0A949X5I4_9CLOT|nr:ATP-binding protein [Clostridium thailandense]MBV7275703.1 ATP-binding protein [Clostridium thailandense]